MLPRFYLWTLAFLFGSLIFLSDKLAYRIFGYYKKSEYVRMGSCQKTGMCCRSIALEFPKSWLKYPRLLSFAQYWYRAIFNFHYLGTVNGNWLVFECHYLTKENTCSIYPYRPKLCREYPLTPLFGHGRLHKGCGYWFAKRSELGTFREKLTEQSHEQERLEYFSNPQPPTDFISQSR